MKDEPKIRAFISAMPIKSAFTFVGSNGNKIASIDNDGNVEVFEPERIGDAAVEFWHCFRHPLCDEVERLRARVKELESRLGLEA